MVHRNFIVRQHSFWIRSCDRQLTCYLKTDWCAEGRLWARLSLSKKHRQFSAWVRLLLCGKQVRSLSLGLNILLQGRWWLREYSFAVKEFGHLILPASKQRHWQWYVTPQYFSLHLLAEQLEACRPKIELSRSHNRFEHDCAKLSRSHKIGKFHSR